MQYKLLSFAAVAAALLITAPLRAEPPSSSAAGSLPSSTVNTPTVIHLDSSATNADLPIATISNGNAPPDEEVAYHAAFDLFKSGKYDEAIRAFHDQVDRWPKGPLSGNALFWSGQASYIKGDFNAALASFQAALQRPASAKTADAMLNVGMLQFKLNRDDESRATLQRLIQSYPKSNAAQRAQQQLDSMK